ncbi:MAG: BlaI/MecI/CopY family transcriptional regulator [Gammaproteobacteria bacterium]|nr:BlaI/MecI/CopY family transcriptional regulator [Gammaproteobacteria bacterium]
MNISDSELYIMNVLWQQSPITANEIIAALPNELHWSEKTTKSLLNRLLKKQAISHEKQGRQYLYYPLIAKENIQAQATEHVLTRLFNGKLSSLVSHFAQQEKLSTDDIDELEKIIKEMKS